MREHLHVDSPAKLDLLHRDVQRGLGRVYGSLSLALPVLTELENTSFQQSIGRYTRACGCGEGAIATLMALIGVGVWLSVRAGPVHLSDAQWAAPVAVAAAVLGKTFGLLLARRRLRAEVQRVMERVEAAGELAPHIAPPFNAESVQS